MGIIKKQIKKSYFWPIAILMFLLPLFSNLKGLGYGCSHTFDYGIFHQAVIELLQGQWNPYMTVRSLHFFNDHVYPAIVVSFPFYWLSGNSVYALLWVEWISYLLGAVFLYNYMNRKNAAPSVKMLALFCYLSLRGILYALDFPVHPCVWSIPLWMYLVTSHHEGKSGSVFLSCIFLCLFRESFPFVILMVGIYYLIQRKFKWGALITLFAGSYLAAAFKGRPHWVGPVNDYGGRFLNGLKSDFFGFLGEAFLNFHYMGFVEIFGPFLVAMLFLPKQYFNRNGLVFFSIFILSPILFLHFLANQFHFHYSAGMSAVLFSAVIMIPAAKGDLPLKKLGWVLILLLLTSIGRYTKFTLRLIQSKDKNCLMTQEKLRDIQDAKKVIEMYQGSDYIVSTGGITSHLIKPGIKIVSPNTVAKNPSMASLLVFERRSSGQTYPMGETEIEQMIERCRIFADRELINRETLWVAAGKFPETCYGRSQL